MENGQKVSVRNMDFDIQSKIMKRNPFLYGKSYIIWIVRVKYYIYKYFLLHLNTFCAYNVMLKIGLKSAFLDRVVNKCSDCSMIEIRGISLILFCSGVFVLSLY